MAWQVTEQEVTQSRHTIALLEAQVTSLTEKVGDLVMELAEKKVEIKRLREEIKRLWEAKDLAVLSERESCARIALGSQISETSLSAEWGRQCAAAIRRRV